MYTIKELKELPDGTIIHDCWGVEFIKEEDGLRDTITNKLLNWIVIYELYYEPDIEYMEREEDYEI